MSYVNEKYDPGNKDKQIAFLTQLLRDIIIFGLDYADREDIEALNNILAYLPEVTRDDFIL